MKKDKKSKLGELVLDFTSELTDAPRFPIDNFKPYDEVSRIYELTGIRFRAESHMVGNDGKIYDNVYTEEKNS